MNSSILYFTIFTLVEFCTSCDLDFLKYNEKNNCKNEKIISKLKKQNSSNSDRCTTIKVKWKDIAPYLCRTKLKHKLATETCRTSSEPKFKRTKNYTYCYNQGVIDCCFESYECVKSYGVEVWKRDFDVRKQVLDEFLKFGVEVFPDMYAYKYGFRICKRAIEPNGLKLCKKECEKEENSDFANKCNEDPKANFKCCVVRHNIGCDACAVCCILPVCTIRGTTEELNTFKFAMNETLTPRIDTHKKPTEIRLHLEMITTPYWPAIDQYFSDFAPEFCIKTDQNNNKQAYYNMTAYRAFTKKGKLDVPTFQIPKEVDFYNPKNRKKYASSKGPEILSTIIGYDKCYKMRNKTDEIKCFKKCRKLEKTKFAKNCNKEDSQIFKCCVEQESSKDSEASQKDIMRQLVQKKFITKPLQEICTGSKCTFCCVLSVCTRKNDNGSVGHEFNVKSISPKMSGYRYKKCKAFTRTKHKQSDFTYFNMTEFTQAHTKDMLCEVSAYMKNEELENIRLKNKDIKYMSKYCGKKSKNMKKSSEDMKKRQSKEKRKKRKKRKKKNKKNKCRHFWTKTKFGKKKNDCKETKKRKKEKKRRKVRRKDSGKDGFKSNGKKESK